MRLFEWFFGKRSQEQHIIKIWNSAQLEIENNLQQYFINYERKISLFLRFKNNQIKLRNFIKQIRRLYQLPAKGSLSLEGQSRQDILDILNQLISNEKDMASTELEQSTQADVAELLNAIRQLVKNLDAQYSWFAENAAGIREYKDVVSLQSLLITEGKILYDIEENELPKIQEEIKMVIKNTEYSPKARLQLLLLKEKYRKQEWWQAKFKEPFITFYHAYPIRPRMHTLLNGGYLVPELAPDGFFMAETSDMAAEITAQYHGSDSETDIQIMKVLINRDICFKLVAVVNNWYRIRAEDFPQANKEIRRKFIIFEKFH